MRTLKIVGALIILYVGQVIFQFWPQPNPYWAFGVPSIFKLHRSIEEQFFDAVRIRTEGLSLADKRKVLEEAGMFCGEIDSFGFGCHFDSHEFFWLLMTTTISISYIKKNGDYELLTNFSSGAL